MDGPGNFTKTFPSPPLGLIAMMAMIMMGMCGLDEVVAGVTGDGRGVSEFRQISKTNVNEQFQHVMSI